MTEFALQTGNLRDRFTRSRPFFWLAFACALLYGVQALTGTDPAASLLVYDKDALLRGEVWRLWTGHLVHSDLAHLGWNLAGLLLIGLWWGSLGMRKLAGHWLLAAPTLSFGLMWFVPQLQWYCGLSGLLNTLLVMACLQARHSQPYALPVLLLLLGKNALEWWRQDALFTTTAWGSVPEAHILGMLIGILHAGLYSPDRQGLQRPG